MKFGKFVLTPPIGAISAVLLSAALSSSAFGSTIYLKADATGSGTGDSWGNACTTFDAAITALNAAGAGSELRVARGCHKVTVASTVSIANFKISGGYRAEADGDEVQDRMLYQSTLYWKDVPLTTRWTHLLPKYDSFSAPDTEVTSIRVVEDDGTMNEPPAFTGEFDTYRGHQGGTGGVCALGVAANAGGTIENLNFTGFRNGSPSCISLASNSTGTTIRKCRFYANNAGSGCILVASTAQDTISDCDFSHSVSSSMNSLFIRGSNTRVENCRFVGNYRSGGWGACLIQLEGSATDVIFANCSFARNGGTCGTETGNSPPGCIVGSNGPSVEFADCAITNNCMYSTEGYGVPLLAGKTMTLNRCYIAGNAHYAKALEGRAYSLIGTAYLGNVFSAYVDGCVIESNRVEVGRLGFDQGRYYVGILGYPGPYCGVSAVNTVFRDNVATGLETAGVSCVKCRGIFSMGFVRLDSSLKYNQSPKTSFGVANCLFTGRAEDGVYDLMQCGLNHDYKLNVVNSVFEREGDEPYNPFFAVKPSLWNVTGCTFKNMREGVCTPGIDISSGLKTDEIPFARKADTFLYEPLAKTPGLRTTADLSPNNAAGTVYAYRPAGSETWTALYTVAGTAIIADIGTKMMGDATGAARPEGAFTRGPVQALGGAGEEGVTLTVRRSPISGGRVSSPSTQSVAAGGPITPVSVTPNAGLVFTGWTDEEGTSYPGGNPLQITKLDTDLVLVANFAGEVTLTFDLGTGGTFADGSSTYETNVVVGSEMPTLPSITVAAGKRLIGWPGRLPETVPGADVTYTARYVEGGVHVVPVDDPAVSTGTGDGLTWANATANLQTAIDLASEFGGEVWIKTGVYKVLSPCTPKSNVTIIGGFAGNETSAGEADPTAHPTILTGDATGNNTWKANGTTSKGLIWDGMTLQMPNPDNEDWYWLIVGDAADGSHCFQQASATPALDNFRLRNLTITGYRYCALWTLSGSDVTVSNVTFVANNFYNNVDQGQAAVWAQGGLVLEDCTFIGNYRGMTISGTCAKRANRISGCTFYANYNHNGRDGGAFQASATTTITNCLFKRNYSGALNSSGAIDSHGQTIYVYDSDFIENKSSGAGRSAVAWVGYGRAVRCRFVDNASDCTTGNTKGLHGTCFALAGGDFFVDDSFFKGNRIAGRYTATDEQLLGAICYVGDGRFTFYNSTFVDTRIAVTNASTGVANAGSFTADSYNVNQNWAVVHCTVNGTVFDCAQESGTLHAGEFVCSAKSATADKSCCGVANSVVWNADEDYVPFSLGADKWLPLLAYNVIKNLDVEAYEAAATGANDFVIGNSSDDPVLSDSVRSPDVTAPRYVEQWGLNCRSPFKRSAAYLGKLTDGKFIVRDTARSKWFSVLQKVSNWGITSYKDGNVADAWGEARPTGKIALGPLQTHSGLLLMVR